MEIVVDRRRENKLLEREEIHCRVKYDGSTPARKKIKEALKKHLGMDGYVVIQKVEPLFGMKEAKVYAKIYLSEAVAKRIESNYVFKRGESSKQEEVKETKEKKAEEEKEEKEEKKEEEEAKEESKEDEGNAEA